ncbi:MAG: sensor histidine kinase, partial [Magnetococcales bacterium]|nr:sensor histidine kinase [Magnetococcales bacterium]
GGVRFSVADRGPGLDPALFSRVVEPFFTTRTGGTGLGLAVVDQLVRLNGGVLSLANGEPGREGLIVSWTMESLDGGDTAL